MMSRHARFVAAALALSLLSLPARAGLPWLAGQHVVTVDDGVASTTIELRCSDAPLCELDYRVRGAVELTDAVDALHPRLVESLDPAHAALAHVRAFAGLRPRPEEFELKAIFALLMSALGQEEALHECVGLRAQNDASGYLVCRTNRQGALLFLKGDSTPAFKGYVVLPLKRASAGVMSDAVVAAGSVTAPRGESE